MGLVGGPGRRLEGGAGLQGQLEMLCVDYGCERTTPACPRLMRLANQWGYGSGQRAKGSETTKFGRGNRIAGSIPPCPKDDLPQNNGFSVQVWESDTDGEGGGPNRLAFTCTHKFILSGYERTGEGRWDSAGLAASVAMMGGENVGLLLEG